MNLDISWLDMDLVLALSCLPRLRVICIENLYHSNCPLDPSQIAEGFASRAFPTLKSLVLRAKEPQMEMLLSQVFAKSPLEDLDLTVWASNPGEVQTTPTPLPSMPGAVQLTSLSINMKDNLRFDGRMLKAFRSCPLLRKLHITETSPPSIQGKCLFDLLRCWPSLETLKLNPRPVSCNAEPSSLSVDLLPQILHVCHS